ncbi:hypothetical protein N7466_010145 [Penicillium verhagenii]|uniref:uncharacterized protein n=1 Tax=Penicillium verhagenii TaxID=1562060 RepID=UPI002544E9CD|nr:uncharacterized protein N7466_010145 [Penicillium verhagenii]KAJ5919202.1 hypothetical protein N7466_010145 [Penicillium verhagenii]
MNKRAIKLRRSTHVHPGDDRDVSEVYQAIVTGLHQTNEEGVAWRPRTKAFAIFITYVCTESPPVCDDDQIHGFSVCHSCEGLIIDRKEELGQFILARFNILVGFEVRHQARNIGRPDEVGDVNKLHCILDLAEKLLADLPELRFRHLREDEAAIVVLGGREIEMVWAGHNFEWNFPRPQRAVEERRVNPGVVEPSAAPTVLERVPDGMPETQSISYVAQSVSQSQSQNSSVHRYPRSLSTLMFTPEDNGGAIRDGLSVYKYQRKPVASRPIDLEYGGWYRRWRRLRVREPGHFGEASHQPMTIKSWLVLHPCLVNRAQLVEYLPSLALFQPTEEDDV